MTMAVPSAQKGESWSRDEFLGRCLGFSVFRLKDISAAEGAIDAARKHERWMIEARLPAEQVAGADILTRCGFRIVDTNVQLTREPRPATLASRCRFARPDDEPAVRAVASRGFSQTRFHLDGNIPTEAANRVKEEWAANFFRGARGDWLVVAEDEQGVCGFNLVLRSPSDSLVIDLIAVAPRARRRGMGAELIEFAASQCLGRAAEVAVGTQIANLGSLRLYTSLGFRPASATYVFHLHSTDMPQ